MTAIPKKKLCWNCEGSVSLSEEICPYCGVSVVPASLEGVGHSLSPPYQMNAAQENTIPRSPYLPDDDEDKEDASKKTLVDIDESDVPVDEFKNILLALLLLLSGSMFFLFGLTLVLFSHNNVFTLQWDSSFWFFYSLLSLPLLFFGWRALLKLDQEK